MYKLGRGILLFDLLFISIEDFLWPTNKMRVNGLHVLLVTRLINLGKAMCTFHINISEGTIFPSYFYFIDLHRNDILKSKSNSKMVIIIQTMIYFLICLHFFNDMKDKIYLLESFTVTVDKYISVKLVHVDYRQTICKNKPFTRKWLIFSHKMRNMCNLAR